MTIHRQPITDASAWHGKDVERDRAWEFVLDAQDIEELESALAQCQSRALEITGICADTFPLPRLGAKLHQLAEHLRSGQGFALLRNFPVADHPLEDLEKMYWGLCSHIGVGRTQNGDGGLIHYVTDGALRPNQGTRGVGFPQEAKLHVDLTDVASLLCVRQAPDDPLSRFGSSTALYNEVLRRRPELLERLYAGFEWDRMNEHGDAESPTSGYRVPFFSHTNGVVSCRYNRAWITNAIRRRDAEMSAADREMLDFIDDVAQEICFEFPFRSGDVQFCNNYTVLHGRAAHAVVDDEARKRMLLRIWLDLPDIREFSDAAIVRYGIGYHGRLGWSAQELLNGTSELPRRRRPDGALAIEQLAPSLPRLLTTPRIAEVLKRASVQPEHG